MDSVDRAVLEAGKGIAGNADRGGRRQVTIVDRRGWDDAIADLGVQVDPIARRGNLLISGVDLENSRGKVLRIGAVRLRIRGETRPCERMDEAQPGLRTALSPPWRAGAFAEILDDGEIAVGDAAGFVTEA